MRTCTACKEEKPLSEFYARHYKCKSCARQATKDYKKANAEGVAIKDKEYRDANPDKAKVWRRTNQTRRAASGKIKAYSRQRYASNPQHRLSVLLRVRINLALRAAHAPKSAKTVELLGCSIDELRVHLESQFTAGMSWDNYGDWHVDHKLPCASFDLTNPEQQRACFHFTNLQPLWALDNIRKGSKPQTVHANNHTV